MKLNVRVQSDHIPSSRREQRLKEKGHSSLETQCSNERDAEKANDKCLVTGTVGITRDHRWEGRCRPHMKRQGIRQQQFKGARCLMRPHVGGPLKGEWRHTLVGMLSVLLESRLRKPDSHAF